jgi:hypothetical protein
MHYSSRSVRTIGSHILNRCNQVFVGTIAASVAMVSFSVASANPATTPQLHRVGGIPATSSVLVNAALADGIYLYGQSQQREQLGQGYFIFEVNQGKVMGALYMPRSSFDCASGKFDGQELALTVVNSYDRTTNPFAIALDTTSTVASATNPSLKQIGLQGFHPLTITESDRRMLSVCKADLQK